MKLNYLSMVLGNCYPINEETNTWCSQLLSESAYMTEYIMRAMNSEFSFDCKRINLVCTNSSLRKGVRDFDSVHEIDVPFDLAYFDMTFEQKELYLYQVLTDGLRILCEEKRWDFALFEKHLITLHDGGFRVEFYLAKRQCKNKKYLAKVFGVQNMQKAIFYVDFFEGRKLIQRKPLMVTRTESMLYNYRIAHIEWSDHQTVSVYNYPKTELTKVSVD